MNVYYKKFSVIALTLLTFHAMFVALEPVFPTEYIDVDDYCWIEGDHMDIGFSKYGEMIGYNETTGIGVGLQYPGYAGAGDTYDQTDDTSVDPFCNEYIGADWWMNGWFIDIKYRTPAGSDREIWAMALFSDGMQYGGDWIVMPSVAADSAARPLWQEDPPYANPDSYVYPSPKPLYGGRKTNGYCLTDPIQIIYNGPERFEAQCKTTISDVSGGTDLVSLTFTFIFNKAEKNVIILKDVKRLYTEQPMNIQFGNHDEWDLGIEGDTDSYTHWYTTEPVKYWDMDQDGDINATEVETTFDFFKEYMASYKNPKKWWDDVPEVDRPSYVYNEFSQVIEEGFPPTWLETQEGSYSLEEHMDPTIKENSYAVAQVIAEAGDYVGAVAVWPHPEFWSATNTYFPPARTIAPQGNNPSVIPLMLAPISRMTEWHRWTVDEDPNQGELGDLPDRDDIWVTADDIRMPYGGTFEPLIPFIIYEHDFKLSSTLPEYRVVSAYVLTDYHDADDADADDPGNEETWSSGLNIIDSEIQQQLDTIFNSTDAYMQLTVSSEPVINVDFTVDGENRTTIWFGVLDEGNHTVVMPSTWTDGPDFYVFDRWEDDSTSLSRIISLTENMTITAYYVAETIISVEPPENSANLGEAFIVDINITNAEDLYSWGIKVQWDRDLLEALNVTEGDFLKGQPDGTAFVQVIYDDYVDVGCTTLGDWFGVWGNGTLMSIAFNVTSTGETDLDIFYAIPLNYDEAQIPHTTEDGYFSKIEPAPPTIISVDPPMLFAELGEHFTINLDIANGVNVYGWQVNLTFDPTIVQCVDATLPPDHFLEGRPEGCVGLQKWIFSHSIVLGTCILGDYLGMNGSGTLVTIEFEVVGIGESVLGIDDTPWPEAWTYVADHNLTYIGPPELKTEDGYFTNIGPRFFVSASPSSLAIRKGNSAISIINVTSLDGFSDTISLSVSSVPSGVTTIFNPPQVTPPPDDIVTSTLTIQASLTAVPGSYVFTITGTNSTLQHSVDVILEITEQTPPHASFFYSPIEPQVDETVTFNASASFDLDGTIETYAWDFGDGTTDTAIIVTHIFTTTGSYNVTLTVTDDDGLSDASAQSVTVAKLSSTISVTTSTTTLTIGENITINGCISPTRAGATVTIEHRLLGGTWSILTAATTDENSECSHVWIPSKTGTYELEASWPGDVNTLPAESLIVTIDVIPPRVLSIKLSGEHDYLLMEKVKIRLAALVRNAATMEPVSNANVTISIYNPDGTHWLSDTMVEKLAETGVYEWESEETIQQLHLEKGVYLAHVNASSEGSLVASDIIEFHVDPPSEEPVQLHLILLSVLATAISVWYAQRRRLSKKLSELQKRTR